MTPNRKLNPPDRRRPLSFPAVQPSDSISPATLFSSLITLSQSICNLQQTKKSFSTQRKNARETIRQISILLIFFQEIHDRALFISAHHPSTILSFSQLHLTIQKLHFLMQDCAREDTRLWMLMHSQHAASQFRILFRTISTTLDELSLHEIDVCEEVKELVELVTKQARKSKFELDPNDERESKRVHSVLQQFERGVEVDVDSMKLVLEYLEIKTWRECNREVQFLENEMLCFENSETEFALLSSLIGFLCYSRAVVFETLDDYQSSSDQIQTDEENCSTEILNCVKKEDFRCPISLELMVDPVTVLSTGQTYDRSSIEKWLKAGNRVCPKTGEKLSTTELVPNTTLKRLIHQQFLTDNNRIGRISLRNSNNFRITRSIEPGSTASAHAIQFLSWFLARRLVFGTEEQKSKAAYEIRLLARFSIFNRACLVEMGTVPPLIDVLATSGDKVTQENAIGALLKLSKNPNGKEIIMESRGLGPILKVLKRGYSVEARQIAAAIIFYLSSVKDYRKIIGENPEAIPALVEMVKEGTTSVGKRSAVVAIFGLLLHPKNHQRVLASGVVPSLVGVLASSSSSEEEKTDLVNDCLAVLVALAEESEEGARAVFEAKALTLIIGILRGSNSQAGKEYCVSILLSLCVNVGVEVVRVLVKEPSLMPLLYSLLTDGTPHAAKKARSLITVLQEFNEKRSSLLGAPQ